MMETGYFGRGIVSQFGFGEAQTTEKEPGDIGGRAWIRYDEPGEKAFKLNAERNNGRAAMLGITGCLLHEISASTPSPRRLRRLGVDALYPTGGYGTLHDQRIQARTPAPSASGCRHRRRSSPTTRRCTTKHAAPGAALARRRQSRSPAPVRPSPARSPARRASPARAPPPAYNYGVQPAPAPAAGAPPRRRA